VRRLLSGGRRDDVDRPGSERLYPWKPIEHTPQRALQTGRSRSTAAQRVNDPLGSAPVPHKNAHERRGSADSRPSRPHPGTARFNRLAISSPGEVTALKLDKCARPIEPFLTKSAMPAFTTRSEMLLRSCYRCGGASASSETRAPTISSALRAVTSTDAMTADYFPFPRELPGRAATRITDEVRGINRVVCDITSKTPWHDQMPVSLNWFCDSRITITTFAPEIPLLNGSLLL
jgi:hypothetical protein